MTDKHQEVEALREEIATLQNQVDRLRNKYQKFNNKMRDLLTQPGEDAYCERRVLEDDMENLAQEIENYDFALHQMKETYADMENNLKQEAAEVEEMEKRLESLYRETVDLEDTLEELEDEYEHSESSHDKYKVMEAINEAEDELRELSYQQTDLEEELRKRKAK
jgi:chromosome segregation ATPase